MATEKRLIDANALIKRINQEPTDGMYTSEILDVINGGAPTVDAVEIKTLEAWLYEIAMNNTNNTLCGACEEIIRRLDGLRVFARERKDNETTE